jgi:carbon-monoxide dehydrogenase large subunit
MHGSLVQGFGQAMLEGVVYDGNGVPLTTTLMDYLIPSAGTIPPMTTDRLVTPAPNNPLGVKGTGEAGCIGVPPAIVNATLDALRPYGVTSLDMPLTPARVWAALAAQRSSSKS